MPGILDRASATLSFHFAHDKLDPKYGLEIAQWIGGFLDHGFDDYFTNRNLRFQANRLWATGRQPMTPFMDLMQINGKSSYVNIDFTPPAIMNKYIQQIMDVFMDLDEKPNCTAIDRRSNAKKLKEKRAAEFRMNHRKEIEAIQQQSGVPLEDPNKFVPEDKDELDIYFGLEYKLAEEAIVEKIINVVFDENILPETKRLILRDLIVTGLGCIRTYKDVNGEIKIVRIKPEDFVYSYCEYPDFRDAKFMGQMVSMSITDFRKRFSKEYMGAGGLDEKQIFELAKKYGNSVRKDNLTWDNTYYDMYFRPYDDWTVPVLYFEIKTDSTFFVKQKTTKRGTNIVDFSNETPQKTGDRTTVTPKNLDKIYCGWWLRGSSIMLDWGPSKYDVRPPDNQSEQMFSFCPYMYDGFEMRNVAIPERIKPSVFQMILAHLKIQQLIAKMRPAGLMIDVYGMNNISLGEGATMTPLKLLAYGQQTGDILWNSHGEDGETRLNPPIMPSPNVEGLTQIKQLIETYNFYLERLQADLGTNPAALGEGVNPRLGLGVMKQQVRAATSSVSNIYDAWLNIANSMASKVAIMSWDDIVYGVSVYKNFMDPSMKLDKEASFSTKMRMLPSDSEQAYIESITTSAIAAGTLEYEEAFKVKDIAKNNVKLAEMYLSRMRKAKIKQANKDAMMKMQMNQQIQDHSVATNAQAKEAIEMTKGKAKLISNDMDNQNKKEQLLQQFVQQALLQSAKYGQPLDDITNEIVQKYLNGNINSLTESQPQGTGEQPQGPQPQPGQEAPQGAPQPQPTPPPGAGQPVQQ